MEYQFAEPDLARRRQLNCAFDPDTLLNLGKVFPKLHRGAEGDRSQSYVKHISRPMLLQTS